MKAIAYLHSSKESMWELGHQIGLKGEALDYFKHALTEVRFDLDVDEHTGECRILKVQIDRRDNDGPYSPSNCKFSTRLEQANNTRKNVFLTWGGKSMTMAQWARDMGVRPQAIQRRVENGWSVERIFTQPFFRRHTT